MLRSTQLKETTKKPSTVFDKAKALGYELVGHELYGKWYYIHALDHSETPEELRGVWQAVAAYDAIRAYKGVEAD